MKVGITCPYSWDVPGGVQSHIRDLAEALIDAGHEVSVISPADDDCYQRGRTHYPTRSVREVSTTLETAGTIVMTSPTFVSWRVRAPAGSSITA